jgi:hypothetical protein
MGNAEGLSMALRLVLMGIVAGAGLTLPDVRGLDDWTLAAQDWMGTYEGAGEDQVQVDEGAFVFDADAIGWPPVTPIAPATTVARDKLPAGVASDRLFGEVQDRMVHEFASGPVETEVTALEAPIIGRRAGIADLIAPPTKPASSELEESLDRDRAFASVVESMAAAFVIDRVLDENTAPRAVPPFESLEVGADFSTGEADSLNHGAEGIGVVAPEVGRPAGHGMRGSQFSRALRLTREAVFAWANLLHGPADVTSSR